VRLCDDKAVIETGAASGQDADLRLPCARRGATLATKGISRATVCPLSDRAAEIRGQALGLSGRRFSFFGSSLLLHASGLH
jgi:hypothetical protein